MRDYRVLLFATLGILLVCSPAFGQGAPHVFVSSGTSTSRVYYDNTSTTSVTSFALSLTDPEGMVLGPDNFLYVCQPADGKIVRLKTTFPPTVNLPVTVFHAPEEGGLQQPQCGHFTSNGDLIVSDEAGSGIWILKNTASPTGTITSPLSLASPTPVLAAGSLPVCGESTFIGSGLTQLKNGDLAFLDHANGCLYIAAFSETYPYFSASTTRLIALPDDLSLTNPVGIARDSVGDIFISHGEGTTITQIDSTYISGTSDFANNTEFTSSTSSTCATVVASWKFLQFSADDTLYAAATNGNVYSIPVTRSVPGVSTSSCNTELQKIVGTLPLYGEDQQAPAIGIALPPTSTLDIGADPISNSGTNFDFGFTLFQISDKTSCGASVSAVQTFQSDLSAAVATIFPAVPNGTNLVPYLGEAGFGTVYHVNSACMNANALVGAFTPSLTNPRIVKCDPLKPPAHCSILQTTAVYPLGGPLPGDGGVGGGVPNFSDFFLIDEGLLPANSPDRGAFCGFNPPLNNVMTPAGAPVFSLSTTTTIPVKFLLGKTASCKNFITDAEALLSVARVDSGFMPIFPLKFDGLGNSSAIFVVNGKQYHLNLDVTGYAPGTYSVSVTFLSGNAPPMTTYFKLVP